MHSTVVFEPTGDGYIARCPGSPLTGRGPTQGAAWADLLRELRSHWKPPTAPEEDPRAESTQAAAPSVAGIRHRRVATLNLDAAAAVPANLRTTFASVLPASAGPSSHSAVPEPRPDLTAALDCLRCNGWGTLVAPAGYGLTLCPECQQAPA